MLKCIFFAPRNFFFGEEPRKSMKTDVLPVMCMCACESDLYVINVYHAG